MFPNILLDKNPKAQHQGGIHKISVCLVRHKKNMSLSCSTPMARLFVTILVDTCQKRPETSPVPPIVGINKLPQKPACLPSAPKIDSITLPISTTSQTWKPAPKVLATDMQKYMSILQTNHRYLKFQILDWNSNLSLLSAKTALTSYYKISFIKILFTININYVPGTISIYRGHLSSLPFHCHLLA